MTKTTEDKIRRDERLRISDLISEHVETIAEFAAGKEEAVRLTALVLRMGELPPRVRELAGSSA